MSYLGRVRARFGRGHRRSGTVAGDDPAARWAAYLSAVEPALAVVPRVHRFARVPVLGEANSATAPVAVWIESGQPDQMSRTRASIESGTTQPVAVFEGDLRHALSESRVPWIVLVRAGDVLAPLALERLGEAVMLAQDAHLITCDDDLLEPDGSRSAPRFRPGPSPDRWLACDDSGPLLAIERRPGQAAIAKVSGSAGWRHLLALALAGPAGQYHAHVPTLLCHRGADVSDPLPAGIGAVADLLGDWEPGARVEQAGAVRRVRRSNSAGEPSVEVIICFRDQPQLLARCIVSLLARTEYDNLRLALVDNGSVEAETADLVSGLAGRPDVRVLRDPRPFNFAALNNLAARTSTADVVVFLNNDTEVVTPDWIETLLEEALRPEVGATAPMMLYPDGTVQHAGAALGLHGYAGHPFAGLRPEDETPFGRADGGTRNWLAVTAACMMVKRSKFIAVGGFDESFIVAGNDVDLCLRLTAAGHRSLCVPSALLLHDESRSRGTHVDPGDFVTSERSYGDFRTVGDPFYNPNLTLQLTDCGVRVPGEEM
jgi:O-antigen biosynthesis protein